MTVNNIDDAAPVIDSADIADAIDENGEAQVIYTATADDSGDTSDGVTFSLADGSDAGLSIDSATGEVSIDGAADHEDKSQYTFAVIATDAAGNASEAQSVTLDINDLDDAAPTVTSADSADSVDENSASGQVVYTASSDDSGDDVADGPISYSLADGSDSEFSIDSATGAVSFNAVADHESDSQYSFAVIATDAAGNASEAQSVTLDINDLDDAAPTVTSGDSAGSIDENSGSQVIYTATADDSGDDIVDGPVTFSLADGDRTDLSINSNSGQVTLHEDPDFEAKSEYTFDIIATDAAGNSSSAQTVTLSINDIVEMPMITSEDIGVVLEGSGADQVVYTATSNIESATYSLVDHTVYPTASDNSETFETVVTIPQLAAATQHVYVSESTKSEDGTQAIVKVSYNADDTTSTGLGLRIHFDSSALSAPALSNILTNDLFINGQIVNDDEDFDGDASTDQYINFSWASLFGQWPGSAPVDLATITFDIADNAAGMSAINFTSPSNAAGFAFDGQQHNLAVVESAGDSSDSSGASGSTESVVTIPQLAAATQHVYVSESTKSEDGTQAIVKVSYNADDTTSTGLGLRIHFDSSALSAPALSNILTNDLFINGQIVNDDEDFDGDASTDQYINFSWASLFGQWPGSAPVDLATITFDIVEGASGSSTINLTSSSNAAGFGFDGQSHDVVISAESEPSEPESMPSQLSIDAATGVVTLEGEADYQTVPNYMFTVTAANGDETASQDVGLLVADYLVSADSNTYTGTDEADVFALADGSAQVTSGDGADIFILAPPSEEGAQPIDMHTLVDFETGVDSIDASVALMALGYTGLSTALDGGAQQNKLSALTDVSADILDLVSNNDTSLNNAFGSYFDDASNVLTLFVDTDASLESQMIETFEIEVGEGNTVEDDDLTVSFNTFIA